MFGTPIESWIVWLGVAVVSVALCGTALSLPMRPAPDAAGAADAVDGVAAGDASATVTHRVDAMVVQLGPHRIGLRSRAGTAHATFVFGAVTPARSPKLERVLQGAHPADVFRSPATFRQSVIEARTTEPTWEETDGTLTARRVSWEGVDVTLVGA